MSKKEWSFNLSKHKVKNLQDPMGFKINTANINLRVQTNQTLPLHLAEGI